MIFYSYKNISDITPFTMLGNLTSLTSFYLDLRYFLKNIILI